MMMLSTGHPSNLGSYRDLCSVFFGPESEQVKFIDDKIAASPHGREEEVLADEHQMIQMLVTLGPAYANAKS